VRADSSFEAFVFYFSRNPSGMYDFLMHCVEIVGLIMTNVSYARCVGVGLDVSKLGFVCGMLLWVQDSSTEWARPFEVGFNSPGGDHVYVCVFIFILHFQVYSQNIVLVIKLIAKLCILPYTK
jgi:hypothetical protein